MRLCVCVYVQDWKRSRVHPKKPSKFKKDTYQAAHDILDQRSASSVSTKRGPDYNSFVRFEPRKTLSGGRMRSEVIDWGRGWGPVIEEQF